MHEQATGESMVNAFATYLRYEEKSRATSEKYVGMSALSLRMRLAGKLPGACHQMERGPGGKRICGAEHQFHAGCAEQLFKVYG